MGTDADRDASAAMTDDLPTPAQHVAHRRHACGSMRRRRLDIVLDLEQSSLLDPFQHGLAIGQHDLGVASDLRFGAAGLRHSNSGAV